MTMIGITMIIQHVLLLAITMITGTTMIILMLVMALVMRCR